MRRKMFRLMVISALLLSMISSMSSAAVIVRTWYVPKSTLVYSQDIPSNETSFGVEANTSFSDSFPLDTWIVDEKSGSSFRSEWKYFNLDPAPYHRTVVRGHTISYRETLNEIELWAEYDDGTEEILSVDSWRTIVEQTHSVYWNVINWY